MIFIWRINHFVVHLWNYSLWSLWRYEGTSSLLDICVPVQCELASKVQITQMPSLTIWACVIGCVLWMTTQAMLRAIGIGNSRSLPLAAALNWVLKDGLGRLCRCIYTASLASSFDTNLKVYLSNIKQQGIVCATHLIKLILLIFYDKNSVLSFAKWCLYIFYKNVDLYARKIAIFKARLSQETM